MFDIKIKAKKYNSKKVLENINININKNGIYGIVGKNGQGKTTFFKCIKDLVSFEGEILYLDSILNQNEIAWCATEPLIYEELTAKEFSEFYRELLKIKVEKSENLFEVPQNILIKEFSTGMKKKAYLNAILQKKYKIYLFDEPVNGLDLESNYVLMNFIKEISNESIVFISSHILEILTKNCDSIFLLNDTKIQEFSKEEFLNIEHKLFSV